MASFVRLICWGFAFLAPTALRTAAADFNVPAAPTLSISRGATNLTLTYRGQTNFVFTLYASSNALGWSALSTNLCVTPQILFTDSIGATRFYKATSQKTPLIYQCSFSGSDSGAFALFVRTNDTFALVGYNNADHGEFTNAAPIGTDNQCTGNILAGRAGTLAFTTNRITGSITNGTVRSAIITGVLKADVGPLQSTAGLYTGSLVGASCAGTLSILVIADGTVFLYVSYAGSSDGGVAAVTGNSFTVATPRGAHFTGTIVSGKTPSINGNFVHGCDDSTGFGNFTSSRTEKVF